MSRRFPFVTVDVFTDTRFGGNPLAVFPDASGMSDAEFLRLAEETLDALSELDPSASTDMAAAMAAAMKPKIKNA